MNNQQFFSKLGLVTVLAAGLICGLNYIPSIYIAQSLSWSTLFFFVVLSVFIYIVGPIVARQQNKNNYTAVIFFVMFVKMCLSIVLVGVYTKSNEPSNNYFLIPFFAIYLIYTIFEVHLMTRLGKHA